MLIRLFASLAVLLAGCGSSLVESSDKVSAEDTSESYLVAADADTGVVETFAQFRKHDIYGATLSLSSGESVRVDGKDLQAFNGNAENLLIRPSAEETFFSAGQLYRGASSPTSKLPKNVTFEWKKNSNSAVKRTKLDVISSAQLIGSLPSSSSISKDLSLKLTRDKSEPISDLECRLSLANGSDVEANVVVQALGDVCRFSAGSLSRFGVGSKLRLRLIVRRSTIDQGRKNYTSTSTLKWAGETTLIP